jgi:hypothetical protein
LGSLMKGCTSSARPGRPHIRAGMRLVLHTGLGSRRFSPEQPSKGSLEGSDSLPAPERQDADLAPPLRQRTVAQQQPLVPAVDMWPDNANKAWIAIAWAPTAPAVTDRFGVVVQ